MTPAPWPKDSDAGRNVTREMLPDGFRLVLRDRAGADPDEWPERAP